MTRAQVLPLFLALLGAGACGGNSSSPSTPSPPSNRNPTISTVTVTPAFGISGLTSFSMSASASDPDGDAVSYQWSFGGATASGPTVAANLTGDGTLPIQLVVGDGKGGTATDTRTVTIGNMTGRWDFIFTGVCSPNVPTVLPILTLTQAGSVVSGDLASPAAWCNVPAGQTGKLDPGALAKIDAQGNFTGARLKIGSYLDTFLTGVMDSTGRTITGTASFQAPSSMVDTFRMTKK